MLYHDFITNNTLTIIWKKNVDYSLINMEYFTVGLNCSQGTKPPLGPPLVALMLVGPLTIHYPIRGLKGRWTNFHHRNLLHTTDLSV
jgi:hypothetical protein